ncbi:FliG C-terminal domain-containing protein, partial [Streptococcus pneumoniae]|nr:FliG C-terminal domain-containing protein [Streptococcus pneumoniae]
EVSDVELSLALKAASDEVKESIFRNMSSRRSELIREEIEVMGPVKLKDVENAQTEIVALIRKLEEEGEITVSREEGDELIV